MSHDAVLQLRRAAHVRSQPFGLLSVRLPASAREAAHLSVEATAAANHGAECPREVSGGGASEGGASESGASESGASEGGASVTRWRCE